MTQETQDELTQEALEFQKLQAVRYLRQDALRQACIGNEVQPVSDVLARAKAYADFTIGGQI